jgi:26S proteasome regulatory subunit N7
LIGLLIIDNVDMVNRYTQICNQFGWDKDETWIAETNSKNEAKLKELDDKIEDAEKNFGETEVREANLAKSEHLCRVGTKVRR